ncbi:MAG: threonine synthase [Candidatus Tectomicrobia bacterium]|uniref:Threonine synthase n=1 Tax=Tectimicrobiota bacterium TaxID=2528274 RepID=A0A933GNB0_UNCTE|nr:threonine synthase [Candidatus Tectomicrobia bacterium]
MSWPGIIEKYREFLPINDTTPIITLLEGNTPLIKSQRLVKQLDMDFNLFFKFEGLNPTSSFKDRGMTVALSKALEEKSRAVICASTGNTSASAAAYAARSGIVAVIIIPQGKIAFGKLAQAIIHGAKVFQIQGNFDQALNLVREIAASYPITLVNSVNPYRIEGQKTAPFEICDQLGGMAPTYQVLPVGNAGNITSYWKGYQEYFDRRMISNVPKMMGFQAEGAAPIVRGQVVTNPETVATAIRIGNPASWRGALNAVQESAGKIDMVSDDEILEAYRMLAKVEGVFCEPASAASVAGVIKYHKEGFFKKGETVVCTLTGHGLKDPNLVIDISPSPVTVDPDAKKIVELIGL